MALQDGDKYDGKVLKFRLGEGPSGPQIGVLFELNVDGTTHRLVWYGSFSENAFPQTERGLRACGWKGNKLHLLAEDGFGSRSAVCTVEYKNDGVGKPGWRIAWVESADELGVPMKNELDPNRLKALSASLEGRFMMARGTPATPGTLPRNVAPRRPAEVPGPRPSGPPGPPQAQRVAAGAEHEPPPGGGEDFGPDDEGDGDIPF